ncbi:hypothetical protein [Sphingomonas natans]|nr:hypothetical protein [Sphingomonas sp. BIUV-7]
MVALAQGATAAPLCRDSKGLFTPCPHGANRTARAILSSAPAQETESFAVRKPPTAMRTTLTAGTTRRTRLCTDSKGLFTPCPH